MTFPSNSRMRASFASFGFIVALVLASGCAQPSRNRSHSLSQSQATNDIAGHVLDADHIIITNRFASIMEKYRVTLTQEERRQLEQTVSIGHGAARRLAHARILSIGLDARVVLFTILVLLDIRLVPPGPGVFGIVLILLAAAMGAIAIEKIPVP